MTNITEQISGHLERNKALKDTLEKKGVELGENRSIELHFWAFEKQDAVLLAKALYDQGHLVLTLAPVPGNNEERWNIEAGVKESVNELTSDLKVRKYVELAARFNAIYDGWGTTI